MIWAQEMLHPSTESFQKNFKTINIKKIKKNLSFLAYQKNMILSKIIINVFNLMNKTELNTQK